MENQVGWHGHRAQRGIRWRRRLRNGGNKQWRILDYKKGELVATRDAFGRALIEYARENKEIIVMDADLAKANDERQVQGCISRTLFRNGLSGVRLMGTAAGLATTGKIPFACTLAIFAAGRAFEQKRNSIAYPKLNVKICGSHGGISVGKDGATHQAIEDLALMAAIPGMTVINPGDAGELYAAVMAMIDYKGPVYLRLGRNPVPVVFDWKTINSRSARA
jgi:transketolase